VSQSPEARSQKAQGLPGVKEERRHISGIKRSRSTSWSQKSKSGLAHLSNICIKVKEPNCTGVTVEMNHKQRLSLWPHRGQLQGWRRPSLWPHRVQLQGDDRDHQLLLQEEEEGTTESVASPGTSPAKNNGGTSTTTTHPGGDAGASPGSSSR
jgi:hypothetical protein